MARIRTVKPELFKHVGLFEAEMASQLPMRLAFIALFTCCDRLGRFRWDPRRLKLDVLPYDDIDVSRVLEALLTHGFIKKYEHKNEVYGYIPSWPKHQKINHREVKSDIPSPEGSKPQVSEKPNKNNEAQMDDDSVVEASVTHEAPINQAARACPGGIWNREGNREYGIGNKECGIGNRERKNTIVASKMRPPVDEDPIFHIFQHWKTVMNHPDAKLDEKRKSIITRALKAGYSVGKLCDAITGCSYTPHNMGKNDRGQRYDGLHVILRDADQIDRFIRNYQHPPQSINDAQRRSQANVHALQSWMEQKLKSGESHGNA